MTVRYLDPSVVEQAFQHKLARLEIQMVEREVEFYAAQAALHHAEAALAAVEAELSAWRKAQGKGDAGE